MKDETFRVVLAGGGSGGHVYPLIAVAEELQQKAIDMKFALELTHIGPRDQYTAVFAGHGIRVTHIAGAKIRRYASFANIIDIPKFFIGIVQALWTVYRIMPDVIFSKGGTGAFPVVLAGWFYRIPVAIHESDSQPGLSNLASSFFAKKIFITFDISAKYFNPNITVRTGVPVRKELFASPTTKDLAKDALGFSSSNPLLLILGGSQGSVSINNFIVENLTGIMKETQVLHQAGSANLEEVQQLSQAALIDASFKNRYQVMGYFDDKTTELALTAADIVVTRAGAANLSEIAAFGVPAMLIPHEAGSNGHQRSNAYAFAEGGGAIVIEESNLLPGIFISEIKSILTNPELYAKMSQASRKFFAPNAAEDIVKGIFDLAR